MTIAFRPHPEPGGFPGLAGTQQACFDSHDRRGTAVVAVRHVGYYRGGLT